jgi:hypothetical protein
MKLKLLAAALLAGAPSPPALPTSGSISAWVPRPLQAWTRCWKAAPTRSPSTVWHPACTRDVSYQGNFLNITPLPEQQPRYLLVLGGPSGYFSVGGLTITTGSPFTLVLNGDEALAFAQYQGAITVTAVPEPATYGMLLGGLGWAWLAAETVVSITRAPVDSCHESWRNRCMPTGALL